MDRRAFFQGFAGTAGMGTMAAGLGFGLDASDRPLMSYAPVCPRCGAAVLFHGRPPWGHPQALVPCSCGCGWRGSAPGAVPLPQ